MVSPYLTRDKILIEYISTFYSIMVFVAFSGPACPSGGRQAGIFLAQCDVPLMALAGRCFLELERLAHQRHFEPVPLLFYRDSACHSCARLSMCRRAQCRNPYMFPGLHGCHVLGYILYGRAGMLGLQPRV